jgi:hypothetical protein
MYNTINHKIPYLKFLGRTHFRAMVVVVIIIIIVVVIAIFIIIII